MTPAQRKRQFRAMEQKVSYAPKGQKLKFQKALYNERLKDLRAVAYRTRDGGVPPEPVQADMFAGDSS